MNTLTKSLIAGTIITLVLFGCAYLAAERQFIGFSYLLYWQGWFLGMLVPCKTVVILGIEECEYTTLSVVAFYAGLPMGIAVYSFLIYIPLSIYKHLTK